MTRLLFSSTALAVVLAGCGSNGSNPTPDAAVKMDAPLTSADLRPGADLPPAQTDLPAGAGGSAGGDAGSDMPGAGGTSGTADAAEAGGPIVDSGRDGAIPDAAIPDAAPPRDTQGGDAFIQEAGTASDGGGGGACPRVALAQKFGAAISSLNSVVWNKTGDLLVSTENWPRATSANFISTPITNAGSSDVLVADLNLASGSASYAAPWVFTSGDENDQFAYQVANSSDNQVGIRGRLLGTMAVGSASITNPSANEQSYIAGLKGTDGTGSWAKLVNLGGEQLYAMAGNPNQDFFVVCGAAKNAAPGLAAGLTPGGGKDVVVAAIKASDGSVLWAKLFGGDLDQICAAAAIDDAGNVLLAGTFVGVLDFGQGALPVVPQTQAVDGGTTKPSDSLWVAKLSATGTTLAAVSFGTSTGLYVTPADSSFGPSSPISLTVDANGNALVAGQFAGATMAFGSTMLQPSGTDTFVAKLDSNLVTKWARRWGNGKDTGSSADGIAVNSLGDAVSIGHFTGTVDFGTGSATLTSQTGNGGADISVVQLSGSTGATTCALNFGQAGAVGTAAQTAFAVSIDRWATGAAKDQIAIVGTFYGVLNFGGPTTAMTAGSGTNSSAAFLLQMQP